MDRIGDPSEDEVWSGDDAAVLSLPEGSTAFTTDVLVEGVDFDLSYASGVDVGWKTMVANISDIAAMGGRPVRAVATLTLPADTEIAFVDELLDGMLSACERWGVGLVGGDLSGSDQLSVGVALLGSVARPILRSGARPGDALCVTGMLGGAAGGLIVLKEGLEGNEELKRRQLRPVARVDEAVTIARGGATSMIDISDGLAADLVHLVEAGGVGCDVDLGSVPVDPALADVADRLTPMEAALTGGEDFELLCTIDEGAVPEVETELKDLGTEFTRIGTITDGEARIDGSPLQGWKEKGWEHLRSR